MKGLKSSILTAVVGAGVLSCCLALVSAQQRGGAAVAIDPKSGERKWKFAMTDVSDSGILTTASDLLFTGGREGFFQALDARTGKLLWKANLGAQIVTGPMTYEVDGKQYVATIAGQVLAIFGLRE